MLSKMEGTSGRSVAIRNVALGSVPLASSNVGRAVPAPSSSTILGEKGGELERELERDGAPADGRVKGAWKRSRRSKMYSARTRDEGQT